MLRTLLFLLIFLTPCWVSAGVIKIKPKGGVYQKSLYVKLSTENQGDIYYTTDGSKPTRGSFLYKDSIFVEGVLVLRAVTYIDGKRSEINTQSYFTDRTYSLPVISIVSDPENFWDYGKGIYVKGCCADSTMPYYGANFWKSWEYECNVELYDTAGKKCFNQLAGMSLFGGYSRMLPQKSLAIIARSKYGKKRFKYPIFKERDLKEYKSFIVRNSGGDFKRTQLRDAFMTQLAKPTGVAIQAYEPVIVYLNGAYWGIQNLREKISEHYLQANFKVDKDNVDILRHNGVKRHGYSKNYKFLLHFLRSNDFSNNTTIDSLSKFMDIHDYIRYNIAEVYSDNKDAGGNIRYFRERHNKAKWRWIFYDLDMGLSNDDKRGYASNTLQKFTTASTEVWPNPSWSTFIIRTLLKNKNVEHQYINTFCDYLNTCFHADTAEALLNRMVKRIEKEIPYHQKRWGTNKGAWVKNIDIVREFIRKRPAYLFQHLDEKFMLDTLIEVQIKLPDNNICKIELNSLEINNDFSGKYFTNVPQNIRAIPKHDYELVGWKGRKETEEKISFIPVKNVYFEPIIVPKDSSRYQHQIIFNELSFKQPESDSTGDWIELYNASDNSIDLSGWVITDRSYKKGFKVLEGKIEGRSYVLLANNKSLLTVSRELEDKKVIGNFSFGLSKKGECVKLYDEEGLLVDYIMYDTNYHSIDTNFSLSLKKPDTTHNDMSQWLVQNPSPLEPNPSYIEAVAEKKAKEKRKQLITRIISGIAAIVVLVFAVLLIKRRRKYKKTLHT